ncbi:MAG: aminotransferase class V-fold PLP-dependent enzyme, partial [Prevotella sp.]
MHDFDNINVATELGDIGRLRQIAQKFCPEELKNEVQPHVPEDFDVLNLDSLKDEFLQMASPSTSLAPHLSPLISPLPSTGNQGDYSSVAQQDFGFGIGIPEVESLRQLSYEDSDTISLTEVRKDFPVLQQRVNGHQLIWFDNGATTQKPRQVIEAISDYYTNYNSNIHRGAHTLAARATDAYEGAREKVRRFINASSTEEIVFVRGTTEGINLVAQTFGRKFVGVGDEVIVSTLDHHANIVPWQQVCKERGATLRAIPVTQNGDLILEEFERIIGPKTKFVSVGHVNNTFGTINNVRRIIETAHRYNVPVLIDGAQSIAHTKVDVQQLGADFFVLSGHKIYAPTGIGVVYGRKAMLDILPPWQGGGNMIKDVTIEETQFNAPPARFEAGTPNV